MSVYVTASQATLLGRSPRHRRAPHFEYIAPSNKTPVVS
jgi:hypothetical protein